MGVEFEQLQEGPARDDHQPRVGQRRGAGAARQPVEERHLADHLALLGQEHRRLAAVLGREVDAHDPRRHDVEPVGFVALVEEHLAGGKRPLAGDARQPAEFRLVEPVEQHCPAELGRQVFGSP